LACDTVIGDCDLQDPDSIDSLDSLAIKHDQICTATPDEKHAAAIALKLKSFTAQEGL
jgi:hypothetical protein